MKQIEIIGKRKLREKHYLKENGEYEAKIYDSDIHYIKNGKYEEIDNTLILNGDYYVNKSNDFKVSFTNNSHTNFMKIEKDNHYINISLENFNNFTIKKENTSLKLSSKLSYINILKNIDLCYYITSNKVKENIIIKDIDNDIDKLIFNIETDLTFKLEESGSIISTFNGDVVFRFDSPYMVDSNKNINNKISYSLIKEENKYQLFMFIDNKWLKSDAKYPVVIDPTITSHSNENNVNDTYIYPGDSNVDRNSLDYLKVGLENNIVNRSLLKFNLPTIGTGSQVINAKLMLYNYPHITTEVIHDIINIHRITVDWDESSANWNTMNDKYDSRIDGVIDFYGFYYLDDDGNHIITATSADITSLVQKWYTGTKNYGIMLKSNNESYEAPRVPKFFSKNNNVSENPKPMLIITYRNQNGLENYMNYKTQNFSKGAIYHNTYNGNLTSVFDLISTKNGKMPVDLKLIYNTNDVVLNNDIGYGIGYRLNLSQTVREVTIDDKVYLEYVDEDGTIHYFLNEKVEIQDTGVIATQTGNIFYDEDGLNLKIEKYDDKYILKDKNSNTMTFIKNDEIGYLTEIKDVSNNTNTITYDSEHKVLGITDANNQSITLVYSSNPSKVIQIYGPQMEDSLRLQYSSNTLIEMDYYYSGSMILLENNENKLITKIIDSTKKKLGYEYYSESPYKLKKVTEYGTNDAIGNYYIINYNFNSTTIIDSKNRVNMITFNNSGNPTSISNLKDKDAITSAYGSKVEYGESIGGYNKYKNKLLNDNMPIKYVKNLLSNSSFEDDTTDFSTNELGLSYLSSEFVHSGLKSLRFESLYNLESNVHKEVNVEKGRYYTFSAYVRTSRWFTPVKLSLYYENVEGALTKADSDAITSDDDFERLDVTIFYPEDAIGNLTLAVCMDSRGLCYIDDVQLEEGEVANNYNLIENSDFSNGFNDWTFVTGENYNINDTFQIVNIGNQKALRVNMNTNNGSSFEKTFNIKGTIEDFFTLSFWYKNTGLVGTPLFEEGPKNVVSITFYPEDTEYGGDLIENYVLDPNEDEWQFFICSFTPDYDFSNFKLSFDQYLNGNEFYITNISLFKDVKNVIYKYDENGNIIGVRNLNDKEAKYSYDKNNELIKMMDTKGIIFNYEYDNIVTNRVLRGISETGISNEIEYDSNGNPVVSRVINRELMMKPGSGKYAIRLKGTNKILRLINNFISLEDDIHRHNKWNIEKVIIDEKDYYKIYHTIINNRYLTNNDDNIILSEYQNDNSLFELINQDNGSFRIKNKVSSKYLKNDNNNLILADLIEDDYNFEFYFEANINNKFIENRAEYTDDGRFITKTIDSNFNETNYDIDNTTGLMKSITNSKNQTTYYNYNDLRKLESIINKNRVVNYEYNSNKVLSKITQNDRIYNFEYDNFLNVKSIKIGDSMTLITNTYEENNGNLVSTTYGNNQTISYEYDEFDRIRKLIKNDDTYNFKYNNNGDLVKIISNYDTIKYTYDLANRLYEYKYNDFKIRYGYDVNNNIVSKNYKLNNVNYAINNILNNDDSIIKSTIDTDEINYNYDNLGRLVSKNVNNDYQTNYEYVDNGNRMSMLIKSISNNDDKYSYKYDKLGNITHIYHNNKLENKYYYDDYNQLIKEDNYITKKTIKYNYDDLGNIIYKKEYKINTDNQLSHNKYEYNNTNFKDQLTKFNNETIIYDILGNPITIGNNTTLTWINGRCLNSYVDQNNTINYKYNKDGIRIRKIVNNVQTKYYLEENNIIFEQEDDNVLYYIRSNKELIGFKYNDEIYYYIKNNQDDIIGILDSEYSVVAKYTYDSWGNIISITDGNNNDVSNNNTHIANINPYRYRSYYYDKETKLYYLNSRYYNPKWGRFINVDGIINSGDTIEGNLYSYCSNDPVNKVDSSGQFSIKKIISGVKKIVNNVVKNVTKVVSKIASKVGLKSTSQLFDYSLQNKPGNVCYGPNSNHVTAISNSQTFKDEMRGIAKEIENGNTLVQRQIRLEENLDLYFAYHNVTINATPKENGTVAHILIEDKYDFEYWTIKEHGFVAPINNVGYALQQFGIINNYDFTIQFDYMLYPIFKSAE